MTNHTPVLIVGAGPTGLMMACELARHGVPFRIIDKNPTPCPSSNATWIQTRTIELLDHMGLADEFVKIGNRCQSVNLYTNGKSLVKIPLNEINSAFPFVLMLPQKETERLLNQHLETLNGKVERSIELIDVVQKDNVVSSTIRYPDGHTEVIQSQWLVACDGANSTVRNKCQVFFPGEDIPEQFIVADAKIDSYMSKDEIHVFCDKGTLFAAFPLGGNKYRISSNLHLDHPRKIFTEHEVVELAQERAHGAYYIKSVSWISPFWIHSKSVKEMQLGGIFFAGDAAHIHSPVGGQGMNTGLQDAYNLAWKLALVVKGKAKPALLKTYHSERHPIVSETVAESERFTKMALFDDKFLTKLQKFEISMSRQTSHIAKKIATQLTQLGIHYQNSPIIDYENVSGKTLLQGMRAPDVKVDAETHLYSYLRNTMHHILLFVGIEPSNTQLNHVLKFQQSINQMDSNFIKSHIVTKENIIGAENIIIDKDGILHACFCAKNPMVYLLRPDNYIAYCSKILDPLLVQQFLQKYLQA